MARNDPLLQRLRFAVRACASLVITGGLLFAIGLLVDMPMAAYAVGLITALQGGPLIHEPDLRGRAATYAACATAGFAAFAAMTALQGLSLAVDLLFLAVIFGAVRVQQIAGRWKAMGTIAFLCAMLGAYLSADATALPFVALALGIAMGVSEIGRLVLPLKPSRDVRATLAALRPAASRLRDVRNAGQRGRRAFVAAVELRVGTTRNLAAAAANALPEMSGGDERLAQLHLALLRLQETISTYAASLLHTDAHRSARVTQTGTRMARARCDVEDRLAALPVARLDVASAGGARTGPTALEENGRRALMTAIQVTLACAVAMAVGQYLSRDRWFWAVLTAFLMFNTTNAHADTLKRGIARVVGTLVALAAGAATAALLPQSTPVIAAVGGMSLFLGLYWVQRSYAVGIFFITVVLAMVYDATGKDVSSVLTLRLEETLVGAAAGILASLVVFRRRSGAVTLHTLTEFWHALARFTKLVRRPGTEVAELIEAAENVNAQRDAVEQAARPLGLPWSLVWRREKAEGLLAHTRGLGYLVNGLASDWNGALDSGTRAITERCRLAALVLSKDADLDALDRIAKSDAHGYLAEATQLALEAPDASADTRLALIEETLSGLLEPPTAKSKSHEGESVTEPTGA